MVNSRGQSLERTVNLIRRRYAKRQRRCGGIADSSGFQIMKLDGSPLDTNPLSSTKVKTATPRGMLSQHRVKNFLSCSRASGKTHSDSIEHLQWHLKPDYERDM